MYVVLNIQYKVVFNHPYAELRWILFSSKGTFSELYPSGRLSIWIFMPFLVCLMCIKGTTNYDLALKSLSETIARWFCLMCVTFREGL